MTTSRNVTLIEKYLVSARQTVVVIGDFSPLIRDLELHALSCGIRYDPFVRQLLVDGLSAMGLHLATRPRDEYIGWTVSLQQPSPLNLFFTGNGESDALVGRAFLHDVEPRTENLFVAQVKRSFGELQTSTIEFAGVDLFAMVERYYETSEQNTARFFHQEPRLALAVALPESDPEWISGLSTDRLFELPGASCSKPLPERGLTFACGCDKEKVARVLIGAYGDQPESLYGEDEAVAVECPRCGASYSLSRQEYDGFRQRAE